jgi:Mor family transcriptional regulator
MNKAILQKAALLHPNEILKPYDCMLEQDGFNAMFTFTEQFSGLTIYVPSLRCILARCLELEIKKEFNGTNLSGLAKKYGFSERHVRRMVGQP